MPKPSNTRFRVTKSFDFIPRPGVVKAFKVGQEHIGLTEAMIARGKELGALVEIAAEKE